MTSATFEAPNKGPWDLDTTHAPRPVTPFVADGMVAGMPRGFASGTARYGLLLDYLQPAVVNGWLYMQPRSYLAPPDAQGPPPPPVLWLLTRLHPKMRKRIATSARAFEDRRWREDLARWDRDDRPAAVQTHQAIAAVDVAKLTDDELVAHLRRVRDYVEKMFELHHKYTAPAVAATGDFLAAAREWTGADSGEILELLGGSSPISRGFAADELEAAGSAINNSETAQALLDERLDPDSLLDRLVADPVAGPAIQAYLDAVRYRSLGYDVGDRTAGELPSQLVATLRSAARGGVRPADPPDPTALRARVPASHRADFDARLAEARFANRLRDERGAYSDGWAVGLARRAILETGQRLKARGLLVDPEHAVDLKLDEMVSMLTGGVGPTAAEAETRFAARTTAHVSDAPPFLNAMPSPPPPIRLLPPQARRAALAVDAAMTGVFGASTAESTASVVRGLAVNAGLYQGTARLVDNPDQFDRIQQGDVLVTRSTSPYFNVVLPLLGAIVTDRGGQLSHAAIVAREFGIPAVVGTRDATSIIPDGATVEVDGSAGEVRLISTKVPVG